MVLPSSTKDPAKSLPCTLKSKVTFEPATATSPVASYPFTWAVAVAAAS
jgi:hypothetical protein